MRKRWWLVSIGLAAAACSSSTEVASVDPNTQAEPQPHEDDDDVDDDAAAPSSKDASAKDSSSKDSGATDSATKDGGSTGDSSAVDAAIEAGPLGCVTPEPPTTCGTTFSATSTATTGIALTEMGAALRVAIDPSGQLHGAWTTATQGVRYAASKTHSFAVETLALPKSLPSEVFLSPRVVVDDCGRPLVAWLHKHLPAGTNITESHVYLATKTTAGWVTREVVVPTSASNPAAATDIHTVDLTLDGAGNPIVALARWSSKSAFLARPSNAGFTIEEVPDALGDQQLAGLPAITFSSTLGVVLGVDVAAKPTLMWKTGNTWTKSTVTTTHAMDTGRALSIASDALGAVHLAWRQSLPPTASSYQKLGYFYAVSNAAGALTSDETVQSASGPNVAPGQSVSVHVGPGNVPVVGIDGFPLRRKAASFAKTPVVTGIANYRSAGMALDTSGRARVLAFGYSAGAFVAESCP